jgi:hypothetical protein
MSWLLLETCLAYCVLHKICHLPLWQCKYSLTEQMLRHILACAYMHVQRY